MTEEEATPIRLTTPACMVCHETSVVELTRKEFSDLNDGEYIYLALPDRDERFHQLVLSGTHPSCWDTLTHPAGVGKVDQ